MLMFVFWKIRADFNCFASVIIIPSTNAEWFLPIHKFSFPQTICQPRIDDDDSV